VTESIPDWVHGIHAVFNVLEASPGRVRRVWIAKGRRHSDAMGKVIEQARAIGVRVESVENAALDRVTAGTHQGVAAQCDVVTVASEADLERRWPELEQPLVLVLEGIQDPRNLGACLRTAEAAGVDAVFLPKRNTAPLNATVSKAASGALDHLFLVSITNVARRLQWLQERGVWIVGGDDSATSSIFEIDLSGPVAVVVGAEGKGLKRLTKECCDYLVSIPMAGNISSLNVSVAAALMLFEVVRLRQ